MFSEKNRKQFVALHKQEGAVVIRGRCEGLVRGRVTFEDCALVQKPAVVKQEHSPAAFDLTNFDRTRRWSNEVVEGLGKVSENRIRLEQELDKFRERVKDCAGTAVKWDLVVQSIATANRVLLTNAYMWDHLELDYVPATGEEKSEPVPPGSRGRTPVQNTGSRPVQVGHGMVLTVGKEISRERAVTLKPWGTCTITATVVRIDITGDDHTSMPELNFMTIHIVLENVRAE